MSYYSSNRLSEAAFTICRANDRRVWTNCLDTTVPIFLQDEVLMQSVGGSPGAEPSLRS